MVLAEAPSVEAIIEVTGTIDYAAHVVERAIEHGKHVILMNAELDGTIGPILKVHADRAGVILTACDGDQPGVEANLYRFVKGLGLRPLLCGNIKGLQDRTRNPTTQQGWATRWGWGSKWSPASPTAPRSPSSRRSSPTPPACGRSAGHVRAHRRRSRR